MIQRSTELLRILLFGHKAANCLPVGRIGSRFHCGHDWFLARGSLRSTGIFNIEDVFQLNWIARARNTNVTTTVKQRRRGAAILIEFRAKRTSHFRRTPQRIDPGLNTSGSSRQGYPGASPLRRHHDTDQHGGASASPACNDICTPNRVDRQPKRVHEGEAFCSRLIRSPKKHGDEARSHNHQQYSEFFVTTAAHSE